MLERIISEMPPLMDNFVGNVLSYAVLLAAVATITMTFLELAKAVFNLRLHYHRKSVRNWCPDNRCLSELLILSVAEIDSADALFDQPTDKMMGQIQAATNVAIDFPDLYPNLYGFLTKVPTSNAEEVRNTNMRNVASAEYYEDRDAWRTFINKKEQSTEDEIASATKARARIDHFVSRKLDAFQTRTEYKWARRNQFLSVSSSAIFLIILLLAIDVPLLPAIILAFFGGMIAPFAKDVVSGLSGLRTK